MYRTSYNSNIEGLENDTNPATLMLFYVDWCPHCKTAKPEWDSLKEEYEGKTINGYVINFEEYNCTTENSETDALLDKYKIEGYPTIKLLKDKAYANPSLPNYPKYTGRDLWPNICCRKDNFEDLKSCNDPSGNVPRSEIVPFALAQGGNITVQNLYGEILTSLNYSNFQIFLY